MRLDPLVVQVGVGGKDWRKTISLWMDEGVVEEESELFLSGGRDDWQKFWETILAIDQKEREPAWQEAILLLMRWTRWFGIFYGYGASVAWLDERSSWVLGLKSLPFLEVVVFVIHSFGALWIEPFRGIFFTRLVRRRNKKIHAKKYCVGDERSKRGRIIWKAWRPRVRRVKSAKGVPVSLAVVEDSLRSKRSIELREEVMR